MKLNHPNEDLASVSKCLRLRKAGALGAAWDVYSRRRSELRLLWQVVLLRTSKTMMLVVLTYLPGRPGS